MNVLGDIEEDLLYLSRLIHKHKTKLFKRRPALKTWKAHGGSLRSDQMFRDGPVVSSDVQGWASGQLGWASGQFKDEPMVKYQEVQIQGDQCEPEELEEFEDAKPDRTAYELGNQDKPRLYYIIKYFIQNYLNHFESNNI